jgi:CheY-like chemotaxis protein
MPSKQPRCKSILLVEDTTQLRDSLKKLLEQQGYSVITARDGRAALRKLRSGEPPALILLDLRMPGMSGWEFREEQKKQPDVASIPIVVLTAVGHVEERTATLGAVAYLQKPFTFEQLLETVRRYCGRPGE